MNHIDHISIIAILVIVIAFFAFNSLESNQESKKLTEIAEKVGCKIKYKLQDQPAVICDDNTMIITYGSINNPSSHEAMIEHQINCEANGSNIIFDGGNWTIYHPPC